MKFNVETTISVLGAVLSIASFALSYQAYRNSEYEGRPFIGAPKISKTIRADGATLYNFVFKNVGKIQTNGTAEAFAIVREKDWRAEVKKLCAQQKHSEFSDTDKQFIVIPNDDFTFSRQIPNALALTDDPHMIGCVRYLWGSTEQQSAFVARLDFDASGHVVSPYSVRPE